MLTRRELLRRTGRLGTAAALSSSSGVGRAEEPMGVELNDVQSQLNATRVNRVVKPKTADEIAADLRSAAKEGRAVSLSGGRHAMGGQQFCTDAVHLDLKEFNRVLAFDPEKGHLDVQAGIEWPELLDFLHQQQQGRAGAWTIRQKQTGVDRVSIAGTLAANAHSRGLRFKPFIDDVESFVLLGPDGKARTCSRRENAELFRLVIGGYGLFGILTEVKLRLVPRRKLRREVKVIPVRDLIGAMEERVRQGFVYGDCQYSVDIDPQNADHPAVFSCYRPVGDDAEIATGQKVLSAEDWAGLYVLARTDKRRAFEEYAKHYLSTDGQVYWSDDHQLAGQLDIPHLQEALIRHTGDQWKGSEMITEVYVSPDNLLPFLRAAREEVVRRQIDLTYGTIRFIEQDDESFLAWAKERSVCILCNLHVVHGEAGMEKAAEDLRRLIGLALQFGGRYYLTYHRWAAQSQVEAAYPQFVDFLRLKRTYDPQERLQSNWYQHYREMFKHKI